MTDKVITVAMLFVVIMTVGYFGQKMGYTVEGIPKGENRGITEVGSSSDDAIISITIGEPETGSAIGRTIGYLLDFATLRIDNIPDWFVLLVDFVVFLVIVIIFIFIRGN